MAVHGVDWDALKLFLSDHPDAFSSLERDKHGTRYLVLTANDVKPQPSEEDTVKEAEAATTTEHAKETEASTKETEASTEDKEESSEEDEEEKEEGDSSGVEDDDEVAVFKIEIKDTAHEEAVDATRNIAVAAFVGALTSTLLSYCAC